MKICTVCKEEKSLDEFSWKNKTKDIKARECKMCHRLIRNAHYKANTLNEKERVKANKLQYRTWFKELKADLKCLKCGEDHVSTLQFHHINPKEKEFSISVASRKGYSKQRILDEISKCIVLCANCHFKEHYKE